MRRILNQAFGRSDSDRKALTRMEYFFHCLKQGLHDEICSDVFGDRGRFFGLSGLH